MSTQGSPTVRRRRLGSQLRAARRAVGLSRQQVAEKMETSESGVTRWETGRTRIRLNDLRALLDLYGLTDPTLRAELEQLAREGRQRGWWTPYTSSIRPSFATFLGLEAEASEEHEYSAIVLPGLLQTEEYATAIMRAAVPELSDAVVEERVKLRLERQKRLTSKDAPPLKLHAIIDEACLYRKVGGDDVWLAQLQHLWTMCGRRSVTVQVLPFEVGAHASTLGGFLLLRYQDAPPIAMIELAAGDLYAEHDDAVRYVTRFDMLRESALPPALSRARIGEVYQAARKDSDAHSAMADQ